MVGDGPEESHPVAQGQATFRQPALACVACHAVQPGVTLAGPSLAGIADRAARTIADPSYTGSATDVEGYIRESIVSPSVYLVPGPNFSTGPGGVSLMPDDYETRLEEEQISHLVAYLATLR